MAYAEAWNRLLTQHYKTFIVQLSQFEKNK